MREGPSWVARLAHLANFIELLKSIFNPDLLVDPLGLLTSNLVDVALLEHDDLLLRDLDLKVHRELLQLWVSPRHQDVEVVWVLFAPVVLYVHALLLELVNLLQDYLVELFIRHSNHTALHFLHFLHVYTSRINFFPLLGSRRINDSVLQNVVRPLSYFLPVLDSFQFLLKNFFFTQILVLQVLKSHHILVVVFSQSFQLINQSSQIFFLAWILAALPLFMDCLLLSFLTLRVGFDWLISRSFLT